MRNITDDEHVVVPALALPHIQMWKSFECFDHSFLVALPLNLGDPHMNVLAGAACMSTD
jgi:hypothetical protein